MKLKRREVENSLEASIGTLRSTLEFVREQEQRERDEKILLHRPRQADTAPALTPARADRANQAGSWLKGASLLVRVIPRAGVTR